MPRNAQSPEVWRGRGFSVRRSDTGEKITVRNVPGLAPLERQVEDVETGERFRVTAQQGVVEPIE
jgi:hypothetical protein